MTAFKNPKNTITDILFVDNAPGTPIVKNQSSGLLGDLKVGEKLTLIAAVFLVPLAVLLYLLVNEQGKSINFASKEIVGARYLIEVNKVIDSIKSHRRQARITINEPNIQNKQKLLTNATAVDKSLNFLVEDTANIALFRVKNNLAEIKQSWDTLKLDVLKLNQIQNLNRHSNIIADQIHPLLVQVSNRSNLALDPDLDSYYSINLVVNDLPNTSELLSKLASYTFAALSTKSFTAQDKVRVELLAQQLQAGIDSSQQSLGYVFEANSSLKNTLGILGNDAGRLTKSAVTLSKKTVVDAIKPTYSAALWNTEQGKASQAILTLRDNTTTQLVELLQNRINRLQYNRLISLAAVIATLAVTFGLLFWITQLITRPIAALTRGSQRMSNGDLQTQVPVQSNDELGQLTATFNATMQQLKIKADSDAQAIIQRDELQNNVSEFLNVTMDISQGDMTRKGKVTNDILGNVVDAINVMTEEIGVLLQEVSSIADLVLRSSNEVTVVNDHIAQSAEGQSRLADQARTRALEVTNSIRAMAQGALQTAQAAQQTLQASQAGQLAVQETLSGMQNVKREMEGLSTGVQVLSARSDEIQIIVKTIAGFASQTNLLALGATLEAAGAGASGKRFAAVADQVRKLADESTLATQQVSSLVKSFESEIKSLVERTTSGTQEVEHGYKIASVAGVRLEEISQLARQSAVLVQGISSVTQQQVSNVEQVSRAAQVIATTAAQTGTESLKGSQSAQALRQLSQQLTMNLSRFKLPQA